MWPDPAIWKTHRSNRATSICRSVMGSWCHWPRRRKPRTTLLPTRHQYRILIPIPAAPLDDHPWQTPLLVHRRTGPHLLLRQLPARYNHPSLPRPTFQPQRRLHALPTLLGALPLGLVPLLGQLANLTRNVLGLAQFKQIRQLALLTELFRSQHHLFLAVRNVATDKRRPQLPIPRVQPAK